MVQGVSEEDFAESCGIEGQWVHELLSGQAAGGGDTGGDLPSEVRFSLQGWLQSQAQMVLEPHPAVLPLAPASSAEAPAPAESLPHDPVPASDAPVAAEGSIEPTAESGLDPGSEPARPVSATTAPAEAIEPAAAIEPEEAMEPARAMELATALEPATAMQPAAPDFSAPETGAPEAPAGDTAAAEAAAAGAAAATTTATTSDGAVPVGEPMAVEPSAAMPTVLESADLASAADDPMVLDDPQPSSGGPGVEGGEQMSAAVSMEAVDGANGGPSGPDPEGEAAVLDLSEAIAAASDPHEAEAAPEEAAEAAASRQPAATWVEYQAELLGTGVSILPTVAVGSEFLHPHMEMVFQSKYVGLEEQYRERERIAARQGPPASGDGDCATPCGSASGSMDGDWGDGGDAEVGSTPDRPPQGKFYY